ncbi:MAG: iron ABC transporter permease, partial [Bdellovibrionota bacterium]
MIEALAASLEIALVSAAIAGALGIVAAWLISRTDVPGRTHAAGLLQLPYAIPPYLLGMAWVVLGNPTVGLL